MGRYRSILRAAVRRAGLDVRKMSDLWPLDLSRAAWSHPLELISGDECRDVLLNVSLDSVRFQSLHAFVAQRNDVSPFIKTIIDYIEGRCTTYRDSRLKAFYESCQPRTPSAFMQLRDSAQPWLHDLPATASILPWIDKTPQDRFEAVCYWTEKDNIEHGTHLTMEDGCQHFGPVSERKGELEFERLIEITESIRTNGFKVDPRGNDNIWVFLLLDRDEFRFFQEGGGNHRLAALAALDYKEAIVQIKTQYIARKQEAKWWPMVRKGYLTEQEAIAVFDRIFRGA